MTILAIDQSTVKTGYAVFAPDFNMACSGIIDLHTEKNSQKRFINMCEEILQTIKRVEPTFIVFEDVALQKNVKTAKVLSQLQGVLMGFCMMLGVSYMVLSPTEWRKILGFKQGGVKRQDLKDQAVDFVKREYRKEVVEDEAEAMCIGAAFLTIYKERKAKL